LATERTAPNSPSLPDVIVPAPASGTTAVACFPTRFQTSAAGRLTSMVISIDA
jgi:hypothetical protein